MTYDLLAAGPRGYEITTFPFLWLARLMAKPFLWNGARHFSITRGRHDIIWRRDYA